jgi:hypothetical protein
MEIKDFFKGLDVSITVSDAQGNALYMNDKSVEVNGDVRGKNMMSCHKESSQKIIRHLIDDKASNTYTIQKGSVKKLIYQTPWYEDDAKTVVGGLVEFSIILPDELPHFVRS